MMRAIRFIFPIGIFILIILFLWRGLSLDPREIPSPLIGNSVPNFKLAVLDNPNFSFTNQQLKKQVSLLHVWASWCATCRAEHPMLMTIAKTSSVPIYAIDYKDDPIAVKRLLSMYGNPYRLVGMDDTGKVSIDLGVYGTPETFIIDKQGLIRYKFIGPITKEDWQEKLMPLITQLSQN